MENYNLQKTLKNAITIQAIERLEKNRDLPLDALREIKLIYKQIFILGEKMGLTFKKDVKEFYKHLGFKITNPDKIHWLIFFEEVK